ncbi:putative ATP synthase subunit [Trypanosoma cruzi]|uniref:V-type proton ATPase subunit F n=2 Tax=Trypanosoma cruzi TaxID=5693 RepID=Q4E2M8_TRYCC|nr:ATP synthase subunit, putative [Trypanosoma cruzi]EAN99043.1 ATP synthase subunit, putative [Trypanosoma cruzi]PWV12558.1 putative ATP synthase subunit [Trypanosoma cruzi]RNC48634.1 ATP synthase subunit [Trypanosoma cruzi]|eukprot:XP_820894.1 ATP synthase subunit [Trypanosoma cruzi strain CL Brener]
MPTIRYKNRDELIVGIIGDEDTVTGFLLAGTGDNRATLNQMSGDKKNVEQPNYIVVNPNTPLVDIETAFTNMCANDAVGVIVICQHIANDIRHLIEEQKEPIPCILEIPSKGGLYDAERDFVLEKITRALGIR